MQRCSSRRQPRFIANIQLVPYLDLLFVLMFVSLLLAPLLSPVSPQSGARSAQRATPSLPTDYVVLEEVSAGSLMLHGKSVTPSTLRQSLADLLSSRPSLAVVVNLDASAPVSRAVQLSEELRLAGIQQIAINTK